MSKTTPPTPNSSRRAMLHCALISLATLNAHGCGVDEVGFAPPRDALYYPLGLAAHPEGRYLYVSSSSFDRRYNASALVVIDTHTGALLPNTGVELGLFSGELKLARRGCERASEESACEPRVFGFLPSRDEGSLTVFEVKASEGEGPAHIDCGQESAEGGEGRACDAAHTITEVNGEPLSGSPYALDVDKQGLLMTHVERGALSRWRFQPFSRDPLGLPVFDCQITTGSASFVTRHPTSGLAFVSDRFGQLVRTLNPTPTLDGGCRFTSEAPIPLNSGLLNSEGRGVAMSADGSLLYHASSADGALRVYDTSLDETGEPRNTLLAVLPVGREANVVRVAGLRAGERRAGSRSLGAAERLVDELGGGLVYVTSLTDNVVSVVDPQRLEVIARVAVGRSPHEVVFLPNEAGELRGYVTNFIDHSVSEIDLQEGSPTRFQELKRIGGEPQ